MFPEKKLQEESAGVRGKRVEGRDRHGKKKKKKKKKSDRQRELAGREFRWCPGRARTGTNTATRTSDRRYHRSSHFLHRHGRRVVRLRDALDDVPAPHSQSPRLRHPRPARWPG